MKRLAYITALAAAMTLTTASCTQNNGHIGPVFGSWSLQSMTVDGTDVPLPAGAVSATMSFQTDVVRFNLTYEYSHTLESFATWSKTGDIMTFDFRHHDDVTAEGTGMYAPPEWLHFEALQENATVTELNGKHFDFVRTDDEGHKYIYKFDRTW
ncbi:MAG: lipocalin-like domain-containing protein [Muribaculaceae bacterium]|nr:lipocalin-like domain-containing protein [Muribaculaceae bacterium]